MPTISKKLAAYLKLWNELDDLWTSGMGETMQAEDLRNRMDDPWYALSENDHATFQMMTEEEMRAAR